ncbi:hypothetical protein FJQ98_09515 [Lysinibacillus agricola]|uniref:Uncharacterized protein n=1 Tax=Lysinibacillus agricola TaxID=2590012 RepID=A0ABX7AW91_9BACI|nr:MULTISPECIES: hypothetical protein [Lysinibacillus]KOS63435.1 hypothetical protein AN161_07170 [Lysinibacillus sp. FJAT-14222]QQP14228.1 hypothetical protein FJQ98_09515 [Lysinibacillus agricola]
MSKIFLILHLPTYYYWVYIRGFCTQQMARELTKKDNNNDLFLLEWAVDAKEFKAVKTTKFGSISKEYQKNKVFEVGMASVLPK